jgi:hypothetical protein
MATREAVVVRDEHQHSGLVLTPIMNIDLAKRRLEEFQGFVKSYLVEDEDFGIIQGTKKATLLKPGADKLCELYGLADDYGILTQVERFDAEPPLFDYTVKCILTSRRDGGLVATGLGSCNSYEAKYKWRQGERLCPQCKQPFIIKGKDEYGGGWICFQRKGGCGAKFQDGDPEIEEQKVGRIANDDIAAQKNTVLKMAKKRAKVDAVLSATRSSGIFEQGEDDLPVNSSEAGSGAKPQPNGTVQREAGAAPLSQKSTQQNGGTRFDIYICVGRQFTAVKGNTYPLRDHFKNLGGKYEAETRSWVIPAVRTHEFTEICDRLKLPVKEVDDQGRTLPLPGIEEPEPGATERLW